MTSWPDKPLIRIIRGVEYEEPIDGSLAVREDPGGEYFLVSGPRAKNTVDPTCTLTDSINEWEEVTAVPTAALKHLRHVFLGVELPLTQFTAIQQVVSHLSANKPSPLDRAVTRVKDIADAPMVDAETLPADRLSLLLDALTSVQSATRKTALLAMVARICADWANVEEPYCDALREIAGRAESDPTRIDFVGLVGFVGDIAASLDDGTNGGPRNDLLEMGHYALAWAAQIIEEEDK